MPERAPCKYAEIVRGKVLAPLNLRIPDKVQCKNLESGHPWLDDLSICYGCEYYVPKEGS